MFATQWRRRRGASELILTACEDPRNGVFPLPCQRRNVSSVIGSQWIQSSPKNRSLFCCLRLSWRNNHQIFLLWCQWGLSWWRWNAGCSGPCHSGVLVVTGQLLVQTRHQLTLQHGFESPNSYRSIIISRISKSYWLFTILGENLVTKESISSFKMAFSRETPGPRKRLSRGSITKIQLHRCVL